MILTTQGRSFSEVKRSHIPAKARQLPSHVGACSTRASHSFLFLHYSHWFEKKRNSWLYLSVSNLTLNGLIILNKYNQIQFDQIKYQLIIKLPYQYHENPI
jgi:hypothetical protein